MNQIWDDPFYIMAKAKAKEPAKPKPPSPRSRAAARLVSIGQGECPSPECLEERTEKYRNKWPATPDSSRLQVGSAACPEGMEKAEPDPQNLGPNTADHTPQRFGLLDFQDIALFLWPPYRQRKRPFTSNEQCLILRYRNARLINLTQVELVEVQAWMEQSETITVEEKEVNMLDWRINLNEKDLGDLVKQMEEDLKRAESISTYTTPTLPKTPTKKKPVEMATPPKTPPQGNLEEMNRSQKLVAKRRIEADSE